MTQDPNNIHAWTGAEVYFAPLGTAGPTDLTTPPAAAWLDLGIIVLDSGDQSVDISSDVFKGRAKAGPIPVLRTSSIESRKITIGVMEENKNVQKLLEPLTTSTTATGITTIQHRQSDYSTRYALLVCAYSGSTISKRWIAANAQPSPSELRRFFGDEPGADTIEWEIFPDGSGFYATEITNDPAMATP